MKKVKPDDYFTNGIMELARFEKQVIMKNHMSLDQHRQWMSHLKARYFDEINIVNEQISDIKGKILRCDPVQLLSFSSDMGLMTFLNLFSELQASSKDVPIVRATEYIQSILVSSPYDTTKHVDGDPSALFHEILKDIEDLHSLIRNFYIC